MKKLILTIALTATHQSMAATTDVWEGPGSLFDTQGRATGIYSLVVENTKKGNQIQRNVTVTLPDGSTHREQCLMTESRSGGWTSDCDNGKGGGQCFGEGLCISYTEDGTGKAYATTIVMDGPSEMRLLRTELQYGQAVRFFREKLHKRQAGSYDCIDHSGVLRYDCDTLFQGKYETIQTVLRIFKKPQL